ACRPRAAALPQRCLPRPVRNSRRGGPGGKIHAGGVLLLRGNAMKLPARGAQNAGRGSAGALPPRRGDRMPFCSRGVAAIAAVLIALVPTAASALPETPVLTRHEIRVDGRRLRYSAEAGRLAIRDVASGEARGHVFYVAYRVDSAERPRPLTFVWNGGPGAPATPLHFEGAGRRRRVDGRLVDNGDTWLTATGLVFGDPVGTGFSRPARAEYADEFYGTLGDVASITEFVRAWRLLHDATD